MKHKISLNTMCVAEQALRDKATETRQRLAFQSQQEAAWNSGIARDLDDAADELRRAVYLGREITID